LNMALIWETL